MHLSGNSCNVDKTPWDPLPYTISYSTLLVNLSTYPCKCIVGVSVSNKISATDQISA